MNTETTPTKHTWLVTGASSGIGAAVVRAARQAGDDVIALDIDQTAGAQLAAATGAEFIPLDVSDPTAWQQLIDHWGERAVPDRVHLNAGIQIAPPNAPLSDYQFEAMILERYQRMMGVNVDGVVFGLKALLPILQADSAIVVTASLAGITPYAVDPLYAMSKHAVVGLVRSLGPTLAKRNILINALCPGGIDTNIIPQDQRTQDAVFMTPQCIAQEVNRLMTAEENGRTWAKVSEEKPAFIVRAPGDRR